MTMKTADIDSMPDPGRNRYWQGKHQPHKRRTPLRLELRERTNRSSDRIVPSLSRLIAYDDTTASIEAVVETAEKILDRATHVDEFVGVLRAGVQG